MCSFNPWPGHVGEATDGCFSPFFPLSLKSIGEDLKNHHHNKIKLSLFLGLKTSYDSHLYLTIMSMTIILCTSDPKL